MFIKKYKYAILYMYNLYKNKFKKIKICSKLTDKNVEPYLISASVV